MAAEKSRQLLFHLVQTHHVITPDAEGKQAEVVNLREPGSVQTVPLSQK